MFNLRDKEINTLLDTKRLLIYIPLILIEQDKQSDDEDDDKEEQHTLKLPPGVPKMHKNKNQLSYFSTKTYVVGTRKNRLIETVLLSIQNLCLN